MQAYIETLPREAIDVIRRYTRGTLVLFKSIRDGMPTEKAIKKYRSKTIRMANLICDTNGHHLMNIVVNVGIIPVMLGRKVFEDMFNAIMETSGGHHIIVHCLKDGNLIARVDLLIGIKGILDGMELAACLLSGNCDMIAGRPQYLEMGVANSYTNGPTEIKVFGVVKIEIQGGPINIIGKRMYVCVIVLIDCYERACRERVYEHIPAELLNSAMGAAMVAFNESMAIDDDLQFSSDLAYCILHRAIRKIIPARFVEAFDANEAAKLNTR
jgi:hypothetical protein